MKKFESDAPKVMSIIDTLYVGGAAQVLLHCLSTADKSEFFYLLCNFPYKHPRSRELIDAT